MNETQLDRFERKFDGFVEYVQGEIHGLRTDVAVLKNDVAGLKDDVAGIKAELAAFRSKVQEQYETTTERIRLLDKSFASLVPELTQLRRALDEVRAEVTRLGERITAVETATYETKVEVNQLNQDMQQRFRIVHERLTEFEKKFAA